jgi:flagellar assembly protein FliH
LFRIDKSFVERMNLNKEVVVITNKEISTSKPKPQSPPPSAPAPTPVQDAALEEMRKKAKAQAEQLIVKARERAKEIEETAKKEGYKDGYRDGFQEGKKAAEREMDALIRAQTEDARCVFEKLEAYKQDLYQDLLDNVLRLSFDIAEKIININLERDDLIYREIAKKAILALESSTKVTLRVSSSEYDRFFGEGGQWLSNEVGGLPLEVVCDPLMEPGGCIAESEDGIVNAGVQDQLQKLSRALY